MQAVSFPTLTISLLALVISVYGVAERRQAARRAERLRFTTIVDDLNGLHLEHLQAPGGLAPGDLTDGVNARRELLAVQALTLLGVVGKTLTSPECRALAHALSRSGYPTEADEVWRKAVAIAPGEGTTPSVWAHRGYAYHLFAEGRLDEARAQMRAAVEVVDSPGDTATVRRIETLKYWAVEERRANPGGRQEKTLLAEATTAIDSLTTPHLRQRTRSFLQDQPSEGAAPAPRHPVQGVVDGPTTRPDPIG
ncbi:hypothetical protein ACWKSP_35735 [Micromonosporaceae bacterium Da 78-11]